MSTTPRQPMVGGALGFLVGGIIGFLMRPSAILVGQLPFGHVITRGSFLQGLDALLVTTAERSFNVMFAGAILGALIGLGIGVLLVKQQQSQGV